MLPIEGAYYPLEELQKVQLYNGKNGDCAGTRLFNIAYRTEIINEQESLLQGLLSV